MNDVLIMGPKSLLEKVVTNKSLSVQFCDILVQNQKFCHIVFILPCHIAIFEEVCVKAYSINCVPLQ